MFGIVVASMILLLDRYSGCQINPSVTIALWSAKKFKGKKVFSYIASQSVGAMVGAYILHSVVPNSHTLGGTYPAVALWLSIFIEIVISGMLMFVILTAIRKKFSILWASCIIGFTVFLLAFIAGPFTGASMNPARSLGPAIASGNLDHLWLYLISPTVGMCSVAILFQRSSSSIGE